MPNPYLKQGIAAAKTGDSAEAQRQLSLALAEDPENEAAWLWLSTVVEDLGQQIDCLERVVIINPENTAARRRLDQLKKQRTAIQEPASGSDLLKSRLAMMGKQPEDQGLEGATARAEAETVAVSPISNMPSPPAPDEEIPEMPMVAISEAKDITLEEDEEGKKSGKTFIWQALLLYFATFVIALMAVILWAIPFSAQNVGMIKGPYIVLGIKALLTLAVLLLIIVSFRYRRRAAKKLAISKPPITFIRLEAPKEAPRGQTLPFRASVNFADGAHILYANLRLEMSSRQAGNSTSPVLWSQDIDLAVNSKVPKGLWEKLTGAVLPPNYPPTELGPSNTGFVWKAKARMQLKGFPEFQLGEGEFTVV
jgi:hypothetical protein